MANDSVILWKGSDGVVIPKTTTDISQIVNYGVQLSVKDQKQIIKSFKDGAYEMVSTYIWTKTINALRYQLSKMGLTFIAEMLDRPDIDEYTNVQQAISEFDAISLAEELGIINGTASFRLKQAMETVNHFNRPDLEDDDENELSEDEARTIIRSCVQNILALDKVEAALNFKQFRDELEEKVFDENDPTITRLPNTAYFFQRTTIRILLALIKAKSGAQLERALANANIIIPALWDNLKHPDRYQVGRSYSELFVDGQTKALSGLKKVLLKVKGFDFVPEDLRSSSFVKVANEILSAHYGLDNFYNEPAPVSTLYKMGTVIPIPAFPICITAVLTVKLGNSYGISNAAQPNVNAILKNVTKDRWLYFFNECIQTNERFLYKLTLSTPSKRWLTVFSTEFLTSLLPDIYERDVVNLLKFTIAKNSDKVTSLAGGMYSRLGYGSK